MESVKCFPNFLGVTRTITLAFVIVALLIGGSGVTWRGARSRAAAAVIVVDSTSDLEDADDADGVCRTSAGSCSLRAAIAEANAQTGPARIEFDIPGIAPHSINIATSLPTLDDRTGGTVIDGYSQPGAAENTSVATSNAVIAVQLVGPRSLTQRTSVNALRISSGHNVIRGLAFQYMKRSIWISGRSANGNVIAGCFIGTGVDGRAWYDAIDLIEHRGGDPGAFGILISTGASDNVIGGDTRGDRNLISGNANDGVALRSRGTRANVIVNNLIGLSPDGTTRVRNWGDGIDLNYGASNNRIGGADATDRNVISGNAGEGIEISHGTDTAFNVVAGNFIGTDVTGSDAVVREHRNAGFGISLEGDVTNNVIGPGNVIANNDKGGIEIYGDGNVGNQVPGNQIGVGRSGRPLPNGGDGVRVRSGAVDQTIGPGNAIANNSGAGVLLTSDDVDRVVVTRNTIFDNDGLAIDIDPVGENGIDEFRHDGPNQRLNAPILARAVGTAVSGVACPACTVEVYRSSTSSGAGDALEFLGVAVADDEGVFVAAVEVGLDGVLVSAVAIDPDGNTSEVSSPVRAPVGRGDAQANIVPGRVEAENYRPGSSGDAYDDSTTGNQGGAYRLDDVDIKTCADGADDYGCYVVGFLRDGEWLEYDLWVDEAGTYEVAVRVAGPFNGRGLDMRVDGGRTVNAEVPDTGSFHRWDTASVDLELSAGRHTLRVEIVGGGFLIDALEFRLS